MSGSIGLDLNRPFVEALEYARRRGIVTPDIYYGILQGQARSRAWSVAGVAALDQLRAVFDSLNGALESGETFASWKRRVRAGEIGLDLPDHRLETIFRTNVQAAYSRGRAEQQSRGIRRRPFFMYDAVNDSRTRPAHMAMDGFIARYDDPIWRRWRPPAGYNCRCTVIALTEQQAIDRGYGKQRRPDAEPDPGFDYDRSVSPDEGLRNAEARAREQANEKVREAFDQTVAKKRDGIIPEIGPPRDYEGVEAILEAWSKKNAAELNGRDFVSVRPKPPQHDDYFAATMGDGRYFLNDRTFRDLEGFNAYTDTLAAMQKIAVGDALSFREEYAIESLWHEINHNRQSTLSSFSAGKLSARRALMETVNQFVSRETYTRFMSDLGGEARHQDAIRLRGYGYRVRVGNLYRMIEILGLSRDAVLQDLERINFREDLNRVEFLTREAIANRLAPDASPLNAIRVRAKVRVLLSSLRNPPTDFEKELEAARREIEKLKGGE